MDLEFGPEYDDFKKEVQEFCKEYSNAIITSGGDKKFEMQDALSGNSKAKKGKIPPQLEKHVKGNESAQDEVNESEHKKEKFKKRIFMEIKKLTLNLI